MSKSARGARVGRVLKTAGPAFAALAALSSVQQAVACEGPLADRIKHMTVEGRILNQLGYDLIFADVWEEYVIIPAGRSWAQFWSDVFRLGGDSAHVRRVKDAARPNHEQPRAPFH
ncbi:MAG: hypothetical protein FJ276_17160 [Planctomycetes bacterium]|nr:hypothetical protein [Planctomycetota bacterium]